MRAADSGAGWAPGRPGRSGAAATSAAARRLADDAGDQAALRGFVSLLLFSCLVLQRFGIPVGELKVSVATPIVLGAAAWGLFTGRFAVDRTRLLLFLGLLGAAAASTVLRLVLPLGIAPRTSLPSLVHWLALTGIAVLVFRPAVPEEGLFRQINAWLLFIGAAAIVQFALQFAGVSVFGFTGILPAPILVEELWVTDQPLQWGSSIKRANGFFLVEPSVLAQFMAVGLMIEGLYFRRWLWFAVLAGGMLVSVSGTGFLVLGAFAAALAATSGLGGVRAVLLMAVALGAGLGVAFLAIPEVAETLVERSSEFSVPGTSGHERFVTPFMMVGDVLRAAPWAALLGIGPGTSEYLELPYSYWVNTPVKLFVEYGAVGFALYLALVLSAERTARQRIMLLPMVVLLLFTGGYHQTAQLLFPILLVTTLPRLQDARTASRTG